MVWLNTTQSSTCKAYSAINQPALFVTKFVAMAKTLWGHGKPCAECRQIWQCLKSENSWLVKNRVRVATSRHNVLGFGALKPRRRFQNSSKSSRTKIMCVILVGRK